MNSERRWRQPDAFNGAIKPIDQQVDYNFETGQIIRRSAELRAQRTIENTFQVIEGR